MIHPKNQRLRRFPEDEEREATDDGRARVLPLEIAWERPGLEEVDARIMPELPEGRARVLPRDWGAEMRPEGAGVPVKLKGAELRVVAGRDRVTGAEKRGVAGTAPLEKGMPRKAVVPRVTP